VYPSRRAAWEAFHGPALGAHTFGWHTKAIVGLFHVAMDDSGAGMMSLLDSVLRTFNFVHPEGGKLKLRKTNPKCVKRTFKIRMRMDVIAGKVAKIKLP
jgi:hypothetical protein